MMIRTVLLASAFAVLSSTAFAGGHYTHNQCQAKTIRGQSVTWKCQLDEKCCYNRLIDERSCKKKSRRCL